MTTQIQDVTTQIQDVTTQIQDDTSSMSDEVFEPIEETERRKQGLCKDECLYFDPNKPDLCNIVSPTTEFYASNEQTVQFGWGVKENQTNEEVVEDAKAEKEVEEEKVEDDWKSFPYDENQVYEETLPKKLILLGDSGVGKTSFLVKYNTGVFKPASFSATVGVALMVMLLGDSGVGKTCLLVRFRDGTFLGGNFISTVGIDFRNKIINVDHTKVKLQIWDTAGQERFRSVTHAYYRDAHALLLLYDVTNKTSFDNIRAWLGEIKEYAHDDVVIMLLGNKADAPGNDRQVKKEDGERLAREYKVAFMETSAKSGLNVDLAFLAIARQLKSRRNDSIDESKFNVVDYVNEKANQEKHPCPPCNM